MRAPFDSINTLRGIAISAVVVNHYLNRNVSGDYFGFATHWISLFFIVSGYCIYTSLEKLLIVNNRIERRNVFKFYYLRIIRIFPLFWIAYIIQQLLLNQQIDVFSLLAIHGNGHLWFIPAILQCYIISPFVFILIYYNRLIALLLMLTLYICSNLIINLELIPESLLYLLNYLHLNWNNTYFLYISLFSLSMLLPQCIENWEVIKRSEKRVYLLLLLSLTMIFLISVKRQSEFTMIYDLFIVTLIPLFFMIIFSIYLLANEFKLKILSWLGDMSYSIYLFHSIYFLLINIVFKYRRDSVEELLITLLLFPLFLIGCRMIENIGRHLSLFLKRLIVTQPIIK